MSRARRGRLATGDRVGGGRLRVDAARAVHKLRDYQLADPTMWVLEAVRAARASGASEVHVDGDADDVWVGWSGPPLPRDALPRLLDELVSPQASDERRALRLLAIAINTALGLGPRWIDVYAIDEAGTTRVRYAPELLRASESGESEGLRTLATTEAPLPPGAPAIARGNVVHLRRFPALEALSLLVTGQEPREVRLARRACEDFPIPLRIARGELGIRHSATDLLRVRLDPRVVGEHRDAFLAIVDPSVARPQATIDFAELGVVLATQPLSLKLPMLPGARIPIRARIDAERMPTNAARSGVRRDEGWIAALERHAAERIEALVARLARELGPEREESWDQSRHARLRVAALQLVAAWCGGPEWQRKVSDGDIPPALAPLFDVPLARDALGRTRTLRELARGSSLVAHTGGTALPEELATWVEGIPWIPPGDALALLWSGTRPGDARELVRRAEASREARSRWLAKPIVAIAVEPRVTHALIVPLEVPGHSARSCVPSRLLRAPGLAGEVAISLSSASASTTALVVDGRITQSLRASASIPYDAIATADGLRLSHDHSEVAEGSARSALLTAIDAAIVLGCEAVARRLAGQASPRGETARWTSDDRALDPELGARVVRTGISLAVQLLERAGEKPSGAGALLSSKSPLLDAPAWPTLAGRHRSLAELIAGSREGRALGYVLGHHRSEAREPVGRPIVRLDTAERDALALLLDDVRLVDYAGYPGSLDAPTLARSVARRSLAAIEIDGSAYRGAFGWWLGGSSIELTHCGQPVREPRAAPTAAQPYVMRVDDDRIVPPSGAGAAIVPRDAPYDTVRELEARLAVAIADAMLGRAPPGLHAPSMSPIPDAAVLSAFLRACSELAPSAAHVLGRERVEALRSLSVLPRALTDELASADVLSKSFEGEIVYVPPESLPADMPRGRGWHPLLAGREVAEGLGRLFQLRVRSGVDELHARAKIAHREARLEAHLRRPRSALELARAELTVRLVGKGFRGLLGFDRRGQSTTRVEVRVESRFLETRHEPLPYLAAIVDVDAELADDDVTSITESAAARIRGAVREGSAQLVERLVAALRGPLAHDETLLHFVRDWVRDATSGKRRASAGRVIVALRKAKVFETIQGGIASLEDATRKSSLYFAAAGQGWLEPAEGEAPTVHDQPILALPDDKDHPLRELVRTISERALRNAGADVRRLQAARRVRWGLGERPRVSRAREDRFRWSLEDLAKIARPAELGAFEALGLGEVALSGAPRTVVEIFSVGARVDELACDVRPGAVIACEPTFVTGGWASARDKDRKKVEGAVRIVLARTLRHVLETVAHETLPTWVRVALRESALSGGRPQLDAVGHVPIFQTTDDRWITTADVDAQIARFGALWVTHDLAKTDVPLDPERVAIRLPRAEMESLTKLVATRAADEELRLDAIARRNRDRPRVASIGPSSADRARAITIEPIAAVAGGGHGAVLALDPREVAGRTMQVFRDRQPLGVLADPSAWPALSWIDSPGFTPDRTWSEPVADAVLADAKQAVSVACERALDALFTAPDDALATLRIDRAVCAQVLAGRASQVRGLLWIEARNEPLAQVIDALGESERALLSVHRSAELPLGGHLFVTGVAGTGATAVLSAMASHAYERMTRSIAERAADGTSPLPELELAELVRAAALGHLSGDHPGRALPLPFLDGDEPTLDHLVRAIEAREPALLVPRDRVEHARALEWKGVVLIDDGSLALRRAVVALGTRVVALERAVADRVLDLETARTPEPERAADVATRERRSEPAPAPSPEPRPLPPRNEPSTEPEPAHPLLARLEAQLRSSRAAHGRAPELRMDPLAAAPLVTRTADGTVELAANHPLVRRLTADHHAEASALLAAHVLGASIRGNDDASSAEASAILALLTER